MQLNMAQINIPKFYRGVANPNTVFIYEKGDITAVDIQNSTRFKEQFGFDPYELPVMNEADIAPRLAEAFPNQPPRIWGSVENILKEYGKNQQNPSTTISKETSPVNPYGAVISIDGKMVQQSPSVAQALINAGATTTQAQALQSFAQGSGGQPYPTSLLQGLGIAPKPQINIPTSITSGVTAPSSTPNYQTTTQTPAYNVSNLQVGSQPVTLTPEQQKYQDMATRLQGLYKQKEGESAFRSEQERTQGVDEAQKTINDYSAKLNALKIEAASIDPRTRLGAAERGVTTGLLSAQQNYLLRENSIKALTTAALLASAQGQLSSASYFADKAVRERFAPIDEQINTLINNLNLIKNSPQYTAEEKAQADAQLEIQNARKLSLAQAQDNMQAVQKIAINAASQINNFVPSTQYRTAQQALDAMKVMTDPIQAAQLSAQLFPPKAKVPDITAAAGSIEEFKLFYGRMPKDIAELNAFTASRGAAGRAPSDVGKPISLTTTDRQALLGAGFSQSEITAIEKDINQYGIGKVLEGISSAEQKKAIQKVYGGTETKPFITTEFLKTQFAGSSIDAMLKTIGKNRKDYASFWESAATEEQNIKNDFAKYIEGLMPIVEQYRVAGYTDKEILALMK